MTVKCQILGAADSLSWPLLCQPLGCTTSCWAFISRTIGLQNKSLTMVTLQAAYEQYSHVDIVFDVTGDLDVDTAVQTGQV